MSIADNVRAVRDAIGEAAIHAGRDPAEIALVAAAKMNDAENVRLAIAAGVDAVGENREAEMTAKNAQGAYTGAPLHFIGHIQSNKINKLVGVCDLIESAGSRGVIEAIGRRAAALGVVQDILVEVNIGREEAKSGIMPEETEEILELSSHFGGLRVLGLMAIPPFSADSNEKRRSFEAMYKLFVDMRAKKYDNVFMRCLSMGMSESYVEAVYSGASMVRIGSAIFGARH